MRAAKGVQHIWVHLLGQQMHDARGAGKLMQCFPCTMAAHTAWETCCHPSSATRLHHLQPLAVAGQQHVSQVAPAAVIAAVAAHIIIVIVAAACSSVCACTVSGTAGGRAREGGVRPWFAHNQSAMTLVGACTRN